MFKKAKTKSSIHAVTLKAIKAKKVVQKKTLKVAKPAQKKQESIKTPDQKMTQIKKGVGQKYQTMIAKPKQFKTMSDAQYGARLKAVIG